MLRNSGDADRFRCVRRCSFRGLPRRACFNQRFEGVAFRFHANVAVVLEHVARDVSRDIHDRLLTSAALCKIGDERMTMVVPAARHLGVPSHRIPSRLEGCHGARRVAWPGFAEGEEIPLGTYL
jgi:hypothetical protein